MTTTAPIPKEIKLHKQSQQLELVYGEAETFLLSSEYLRVFSPSAEVMGHGPGQEILQTGKKAVRITAIRAVGNYAIQISFDDEHDSGIYSWSYLHTLAVEKEQRWQHYLEKLHEAGASRDPAVQVIRIGN